MTKERKLDIWKKDAVENGFTCENCAYSRQDTLIYICCCAQADICHSKNYFCAWFEQKEKDGKK